MCVVSDLDIFNVRDSTAAQSSQAALSDPSALGPLQIVGRL